MNLSELKERLKQLEQEQERQQHDLFDLRDLEEIARMESQMKTLTDKSDISAVETVDDIDVTELDQEVGKNRQGYVVCLMFDPRSPSEWSEEGGGGWRSANNGMRYTTLEQAKACYLKLKKQWPDYPLKLIAKK